MSGADDNQVVCFRIGWHLFLISESEIATSLYTQIFTKSIPCPQSGPQGDHQARLSRRLEPVIDPLLLVPIGVGVGIGIGIDLFSFDSDTDTDTDTDPDYNPYRDRDAFVLY
jgi:hypothetical protein